MRLFELFTTTALLEYNRDVTAQKLGQSLLQKFRKEPAQWQHRVTGAATDYDDHALQYLLELVERADPTKNKQYVPWIIRNYINNPSLKFEDAVSKVTEPLKKFFNLVNKKQIPAPNNDIGRIKNLAQLFQIVDQYPDVEDKDKDDNKGQSEQVYKDQDIRVIKPKDQEAACYYGQGTKWCTAANANNMFDTYNGKGPMYIIIPAKPMYNGEKYQWHFETKQFMNEKDERSPVVNLVKRYPQLKEIFYDQAHNYDIKGLLLDPNEYEERLRKFPEAIKNTLMERIRFDVGVVAKAMLTQLRREVRELNKYTLDSQEFIEMVQEAFKDNGINLVRSIISAVGGDLDTWADEDSMHDILSDQISNWSHEQEFRIMIMDILEDLDIEQAQMDASFTIDGEILDWLLGTIENTVEEYL